MVRLKGQRVPEAESAPGLFPAVFMYRCRAQYAVVPLEVGYISVATCFDQHLNLILRKTIAALKLTSTDNIIRHIPIQCLDIGTVVRGQR